MPKHDVDFDVRDGSQVAAEQLVDEGAVHLVCPGMSFLAACPGEEDDEVSISTLWTRKGNFIEWIKSGSSVSVALRRQHR